MAAPLNSLAAALRVIREPDPRHLVHLSKGRRSDSTRCGIEIVPDGKARTRRPYEPRRASDGSTVMDRTGIVSCGRCLGAKPEGRLR